MPIVRLAARAPRLRAPVTSTCGITGHHRLPPSVPARYHLVMQVVSGTVVEGRVVLNGASLPEGTVVTVYAQEPGDIVRLPPHLQAELEEAIDEADREEGSSAEELFAQLKQYG